MLVKTNIPLNYENPTRAMVKKKNPHFTQIKSQTENLIVKSIFRPVLVKSI